MAEDSQSLPLTTTKYKSDEQQKLPIYHNPNTTKSPNKCFIYVFSAFVFLAVAALIFSLIVLRLSSPTVHLSSISIAKFSVIADATANSTSQSPIALTLVPEFAVANPNFGPFNFDDGTVGFLHAGAVVGRTTTGAGRAEAKGTERMNVTVEANLATNNNASDFGVLNLVGFANWRGRVRLIHVFRKSFSPAIACSVHLDLNSRRILPDWVCE